MSGRLIFAGLATAASASIIPRHGECCFQINASGPVAGPLGQLGDGQNRVGGSYPPATYCLKDGGLYDKDGRGCILTPPTTQWQCDAGAAPTYGFSIGPDNSARYNGSPEFWACPVNDYGEWNIYTVPVKDQKKCVPVSLHTSTQCGAPPPAPPPAPPAAPPAPPAPKYEAPPPAPPPAPPVYHAPPPPPPPPPAPPVYHAPPPPPPPPPAPPVYHSPVPEYKPSSSSAAEYKPSSTVPAYKPSSSSAAEYKPSSTVPAYKPTTTSAAAYQSPSSSSAGYAAPSSTGYACNPAHEYPEGVKCVESNGTLTLTTPTAKPM